MLLAAVVRGRAQEALEARLDEQAALAHGVHGGVGLQDQDEQEERDADGDEGDGEAPVGDGDLEGGDAEDALTVSRD